MPGSEPEHLGVDAQGVHQVSVGLGHELDQAAAADRAVGKAHLLPKLAIRNHVNARAIGAADVERDRVGLLAVEGRHHALAARHVRPPFKLPRILKTIATIELS